MNATTVVSNGYIYEIGGQDATPSYQSTVYYAKLNSDGSTGAWSANTNTLPVIQGQSSAAVVNGYVYSIGGANNSSTVYYASTSRLQVGASLDLVGLQSGDGSAGGNLSAASGNFGGNLQVQGQASFAQGVGVAGNLTTNGSALFASSTGLTSAFQIQSTSGSQAINVNTVTTSNLISNSDFESTINGWSGKGAATIARNDTTAVGAASGVGSLKISTTAAANDGTYFNYTFKTSTQYTLSLYARSSAGTVSTISIGHQDVSGTDIDCITGQSITTTWTRFTCTFTTGGTITPPTQIYIKQSDAVARTFYIDGVQLEQAGSASNFQGSQANFQVQTATNTITLDGSDSGALGSWSTDANSLPVAIACANSITANGYVYVIGGNTSNSCATNVSTKATVYYAKLNADGSMGAWQTASNPLPNARVFMASATANGYVYVMAGQDTTGTLQSTVYYAKLNADGSIGAWQTSSNSLPQALQSPSSVIANGYIYALNGYNGSSNQSTVYYAKLNADGSMGAWQTNPNPTPGTTFAATSVVANGYVYVMGGNVSSNIYYAKLNSDGSTGTWTTQSSLIIATSWASSVVVNGHVYYIGGGNASYARLNPDGSTGAWANANAVPNSVIRSGSIAANGYVYLMGGNSSSIPVSTVYYASSSRIQVGANLDLVGLQGGDLSDPGDQSSGSVGGSLTAGNGLFVGSLQVQGAASFAQSVAISGNLSAASSTGTLLGVDVGNNIVTIGFSSSINANSTIHIADSSAGIQTITIGSTSSSSAVTIQAGTGDITLAGHLQSTQTTAPTAGTPSNCGVIPSAAVTASSTDSAGSFTLTAGTGAPTTCDTIITFNATYGSAPKSVIITPTLAVGSATNQREAYISAINATSFTISINTNLAGNTPAASEIDSFYYWVIK
ncbi:MAG: hypothetical protein ACREGG_03840 [Candidatus Saccharimonadales bacterium]